MKITKFKRANSLFNIGPRCLQCETNPYEAMGWDSSDVVRFVLAPLLQGQTKATKPNRAYHSLIIEKCFFGGQPNLIVLTTHLLFKNAVYPLMVDTKMHSWSSSVMLQK